MSFLTSIIGFLLFSLIGYSISIFFNWIDLYNYYGKWFGFAANIVFGILAFMGGCIGAKMGKSKYDDFTFGFLKIIKQSIVIRVLFFILFICVVGYFSYNVWLHCSVKHPFKIAVFITVLNVLFNMLFLANFMRIWHKWVEDDDLSVGSISKHIVVILLVLTLDYAYLIAPVMGWKPVRQILVDLHIVSPVVKEDAPNKVTKVSKSNTSGVVKNKSKKKSNHKIKKLNKEVASDTAYS